MSATKRGAQQLPEADVYDMIKNIEFRQVRDDFQDQLQHDIRKINDST